MDRDEIKGLTQQAFTAMRAWAEDPDGFEMTQSQIATYVPGPDGEIKLINGFVNLAGLLLDELEEETKRDRVSLLEDIARRRDC
jgi:hypothetical protein